MTTESTASRYLNDGWMLILAFACMIFSWTDVNHAFMLSFLMVPLAIYAAIHKFRDGFSRPLARRFLTYFGCLLLLVSGPSGCAFATHKTEESMSPVIAALERFRDVNGNYPANLELLKTEIPNCYSPKRKPLYVALASGKKFDLTCMTFAFNKHTYESNSKTWRDWD
jgi:hypothetical protein